MLFIHTDVDIKDGKTGSVVPMACYRRANRVTGSAGAGTTTGTAFEKQILTGGKAKKVISITWGCPKESVNTRLPRGSPFEFVIEVRKDGTSHPHAWARLPAIGRFENWD
jgi:hypothetical protein